MTCGSYWPLGAATHSVAAGRERGVSLLVASLLACELMTRFQPHELCGESLSVLKPAQFNRKKGTSRQGGAVFWDG